MKGAVIDFGAWRRNRETKEESDLHTTPFVEAKDVLAKDIQELLKLAQKGKNFSLGETATPVQFKKAVEGKIGGALIDRRLIDPALFFCGMYVARLLTETMTTMPKSWYAIDFRQEALDKGNSSSFKEGGDMCFLIASVFPERGNWRLMTPEYYEKMGIGFYFEFYYRAKREIGYHMGSCFKTIAEVTQSCLGSL